MIQTETIERGADEKPAPADPTREGYEFKGWKRSTDPQTGNVTYEAQWEQIPETKKIRTYIDPQDETGNIVIKSKHEGESGYDVVPDDPKHNDMDFVDWVKGEDAAGNEIWTAVYKPDCDNPQNKITVIYEDIGPDGTEDRLQTSYIEEGEEIPPYTGEIPEKEGYTFDGWNAPEEIKDEDGKVTAYIFTAKWTKNPEPPSHWVTYVDPDGTTIYMEKTTVKDGEPDPEAPKPVKEGYVLEGWDKKTDADGNETYTAKWKAITHSVTYVDPDGTVYQETKDLKEWDEEPPAPKNPTKADGIFGGWERSEDKDGNVTYTAKWLPVTHTVTFVDGRSGDVLDKATDVPVHGNVDKIPAPKTYDNYEFKGWRTPDGKLVTDLKVEDVTSDLVYTAVYECTIVPAPNDYVVTYVDSRTGEVLKDETVYEHGSSTVPTPKTYEGYRFKGWRTPDGEIVTELTVEDVTSDLTFTALYDRVYDEAVVISRLIHYKYINENGEEVQEDVVNSVRFTRQAIVDAVTGETTFTEWTPRYQTYPRVDSPEIEGFTPDHAYIDEQTVWPNGDNEELWVIYNPIEYEEVKDFTRTVKYRYYTEDGEEASADVVQKVVLKRSYTLDPDTKEKVYGEWVMAEASQEAVSPEIEGFKADKLFVSAFMPDLHDPHDGADEYVIYNKIPEPVPETIWVTYVDPDGTVYVEKTTINKGDPEPAPPADPEKSGYVFGGWRRTTDDNGNVTYTANWVKEGETPPDTYWVTYIGPDGEVYMVKTYVDKGEKEPEGPDPKDMVKSGYIFDGWDKEVDDDGNITYIAKWKKTEEPVDPTKPADPTDPSKPSDPGQPVTPQGGQSGQRGQSGTAIDPATGKVVPGGTSGAGTGDTNYTFIWIIVAAAAAAAAAIAAVAVKRRKKEE